MDWRSHNGNKDLFIENCEYGSHYDINSSVRPLTRDMSLTFTVRYDLDGMEISLSSPLFFISTFCFE